MSAFICDPGHLSAYDSSELACNPTTKNLAALATATVQNLVDAIFALPTKSTSEALYAQLPRPTTTLPRERRIPKPKPPTKWDTFAKAKGILNKKKTRFVHDEGTGEDKPAYGYKSKSNDKMADWLIEVPDNAPAGVDVRSIAKDDKKDRVAKNKKQHAANLDRAAGGVEAAKRKVALDQSIKISRKSTASLGNFDKALINEPKFKRNDKRKFPSNTGDSKAEQLKTAAVVDKIAKRQIGSESTVVMSSALKQVDKSKVVNDMKKKQKKSR